MCFNFSLKRHPRPTLPPEPQPAGHVNNKTSGRENCRSRRLRHGEMGRWGEMGGLVTSCDNQTNNPAPAKPETIKSTYNLFLLSSKHFEFPNQEKAFKLESYNLLKLNVSISFKVQMRINSSSIKLMHLLVCPDIFRCRCLTRM